MNKRIILIIALFLFAAALVTVIIVKNCGTGADEPGTDTSDKEQAPFPIEFSDRLVGQPFTETRFDSSTIEILFGDVGFIRKTYAVLDNSGGNRGFGEKSELSIGGIDVTFFGENGLVYLAVWNHNNYAYTVSINSGFGVSAEEMAEYVKATK